MMSQEMRPEMSLLEQLGMHMQPSESEAVAAACYSICLEVYSQVQQTLLHPECKEAIKPDQLDTFIERTFVQFIRDPDIFKGLKAILQNAGLVSKFKRRKESQSRKILRVARSLDMNLPLTIGDYGVYDPDNLPSDEVLHEALIQFAYQYIEEQHSHDVDHKIFYDAQNAEIRILTPDDIPKIRQAYNANLINVADLIDDPAKLQDEVGMNGGFLRTFDECPEYAHAIRHPVENDRISINVGAFSPSGSVDAWQEATIFKRNMSRTSRTASKQDTAEYLSNKKHGRVNHLEVSQKIISLILECPELLIHIKMVLRNKISGLPRHIVERVNAVLLHAIASYNSQFSESGHIETYCLEGLHTIDANKKGPALHVASPNVPSAHFLNRVYGWRPYAEFVDSNDTIERVIKNVAYKIFATWLHGSAPAPKAIRKSIEAAQSARRLRGIHAPDPAFEEIAEAVQNLASRSE